MKRTILSVSVIFLALGLSAQNTADRIIANNKGLHIGGYGQIDMNLPLSDENVHYNGKLDVHRLVTFLGYNFNEKVSFVSEIEYEHVVEVYVEQAFLSYRLKDNMSVQAGLMLIPMGIQNLYHEPPTFNGVERTNVDKYIVPTTWREMGLGVSGNAEGYSLNYQIMLVNGFNGYDTDGGVFSGKKGLRSGRQKGAESYMTKPDLAARVSYYGMPGWNLGASLYKGESETLLYNELNLDDEAAVTTADSSKIDIQMIGLDARYADGPIQARAQYIVANLENTTAYNNFTGSDLGSVMTGYYLEGGYNLLNNKDTDNELIVFARHENYNTHDEVEEGIDANLAYNRTENTIGLTYKIASGAAFKADYQFLSNEATDEEKKQFNLGVAVWF
ncbi:MAG: porin [Bacteroidota bacterium]|nr:porin [Bacteroidota bacterium]